MVLHCLTRFRDNVTLSNLVTETTVHYQTLLITVITSHAAKPAGLEARTAKTVIRKDVDVLTDEEIYALRQALSRFQNDSSVDGYQAVAEFHGLPARCPYPDARNRYACCIHGMATFPHWHRLFVVQVSPTIEVSIVNLM